MPDPIPPPRAGAPAEVPHLLSQAVSDGDLDAAAALYEPTAALVIGHVTATQPDQVRAALAQLLAAKVPLRRDPGDVRKVGTIATLAGRWTLRGTGPDLVPLDLFGWQHSVVRRSLAGDWRFLLDHWVVESEVDGQCGRSRTPYRSHGEGGQSCLAALRAACPSASPRWRGSTSEGMP
jgi:ketosteroid isomerase-like protein